MKDISDWPRAIAIIGTQEFRVSVSVLVSVPAFAFMVSFLRLRFWFRPCGSNGRLRGEEIESQPFRQVLGDALPLDAVAGPVEPRRKGA